MLDRAAKFVFDNVTTLPEIAETVVPLVIYPAAVAVIPTKIPAVEATVI